MLDPIAARLAVLSTCDWAHSALPGAPVLPEPAAARPLRRRTALALRRLADRLEPAPRLSPRTR
jgi:hypothetical protein